MIIRAFTLTAAALFAIVAAGSQAEAKGCIKGAIVGGVAGHYAAGHGLLGAAGGCLVGRHYSNKHAREQQEQQWRRTHQNSYGTVPARTY